MIKTFLKKTSLAIINHYIHSLTIISQAKHAVSPTWSYISQWYPNYLNFPEKNLPGLVSVVLS